LQFMQSHLSILDLDLSLICQSPIQCVLAYASSSSVSCSSYRVSGLTLKSLVPFEQNSCYSLTFTHTPLLHSSL
jgi:hypothetical protein